MINWVVNGFARQEDAEALSDGILKSGEVRVEVGPGDRERREALRVGLEIIERSLQFVLFDVNEFDCRFNTTQRRRRRAIFPSV